MYGDVGTCQLPRANDNVVSFFEKQRPKLFNGVNGSRIVRIHKESIFATDARHSITYGKALAAVPPVLKQLHLRQGRRLCSCDIGGLILRAIINHGDIPSVVLFCEVVGNRNQRIRQTVLLVIGGDHNRQENFLGR